MKTPHPTTKLIAVVAAMLTLAVSQASAVIAIITPVAMAFGQTARVNLLNTSESAIIIVNSKFIDSEGRLLGEFGGSIAPGRTMSFDLNRDTLPGTQSRVQFHVVLEGEAAQLRKLLSSLEVFNNADGRTTVFIGDPNEFIDPSDPSKPRRAR